jgi:predicted membrane protein
MGHKDIAVMVSERDVSITSPRIAYFSMEVGLDPAMPAYAGGLGVLAGDTLRAAADLGQAFRWLPSLLVLLGIWQLGTGKLRWVVGPVVLITAGVVIQLAVLGLLTVEVMSRWWPVVLVLIGLSIILERVRPGRDRIPAATSNTVALVALLGDAEHRSASSAFQGGQVTSVLGDAVVDLREATVGQPPAQLEVFVGLGDAKVIVPPDWAVRNQATAILGDKKDRRRRRGGTHADPPHLIITGTVLLGDLTLDD